MAESRFECIDDSDGVASEYPSPSCCFFSKKSVHTCTCMHNWKVLTHTSVQTSPLHQTHSVV